MGGTPGLTAVPGRASMGRTEAKASRIRLRGKRRSEPGSPRPDEEKGSLGRSDPGSRRQRPVPPSRRARPTGPRAPAVGCHLGHRLRGGTLAGETFSSFLFPDGSGPPGNRLPPSHRQSCATSGVSSGRGPPAAGSQRPGAAGRPRALGGSRRVRGDQTALQGAGGTWHPNTHSNRTPCEGSARKGPV